MSVCGPWRFDETTIQEQSFTWGYIINLNNLLLSNSSAMISHVNRLLSSGEHFGPWASCFFS